MSPRDEDETGGEGIRVTDRRRFTETGDDRPDGDAHVPTEASGEPEGSPAPAAAADSGAGARAAEPEGAPPGSPGAGFSVESLGVEAVFYVFWQSAALRLGAVDPATGAAMPVDLEEARQSIELLRILEDKTRGNLSEAESETLGRLLHDAQMRYVAAARQEGEGHS